MRETIIEGIETLTEGLTLTEGPRWRDGRIERVKVGFSGAGTP